MLEEELGDQRPCRQPWPYHGRTQSSLLKRAFDITDERIFKKNKAQGNLRMIYWSWEEKTIGHAAAGVGGGGKGKAAL